MEIKTILATAMILAFIVNIIVQMTKEFVPLPSQLWTIIVSAIATTASVFAASAQEQIELNATTLICTVLSSPVIAYLAMFGFDTFKNLWIKFQSGNKIN